MKEKNMLAALIFLAVLSSFLSATLLSISVEAADETEGTDVNGIIVANTTWTLVESPYIVVGGVIVDESAVLTIEPGVVVKFVAGANLVIDGDLIAQGNAANEIKFTSNATAPAPGDWAGIQVRSSGRLYVKNSLIEYATTGLKLDSRVYDVNQSFIDSRVVSNVIGITHSGYSVNLCGLTIENNTDCGFFVDFGSLEIKDSLISKNYIGIKGTFGNAYIDNCTISNNTHDGISVVKTVINELLNSKIENNGGWGIYTEQDFWNCSDTIISNNSGGGLYTSRISSFDAFSLNTRIYDSKITNNIGYGVFSLYNVLLSGSIISDNSNCGILAEGVEITSTTIINNGNPGVSAATGKITFSNMYNNTMYEVKNSGEEDSITAAYNWWGTTNENLIKERIYDRFDNISAGAVTYTPFLTSPNATLTILTSGVSSNEPVLVQKDGTPAGLIHDGQPLKITLYSGYTKPRMGTFSLSIDDTKIWSSNPNARYKFNNWAGSASNGLSNSITLTVTADSSITAFYDTQYLTNFTFRNSSGTNSLYVTPSQIQLTSDSGLITLTSFQDQWLYEGTATIKQILWQGNNVKPAADPTHTPTAGGTWTINCQVYTVSFADAFKDNKGTDLDVKPSSFQLTFPNGTNSGPLDVGTYLIQNGTTTWHSIIWQDTEVGFVSPSTFDAAKGNPTINCEVYSLTINPVFYDNTGISPIQPSSWSIMFPDGTNKTVSSLATYNQTKTGNYSIVSVVWKGTEVIPDTPPIILLTSDMSWSPTINCLLPSRISISLSSSTSYIGFQVEIKGNLACNEVELSGTPILLSYSVTGGDSWNQITLVTTISDGSYSAVWIPSATGNYLVRASWSGNSTYPEITNLISLAVTPFQEQNVFSVTSNSTLSALVFDSVTRELRFAVTGENGTTGFVEVTVAKSLVANVADLKVYLDGASLDYTAQSTDDSWVLYFTYAHSTHNATVNLGATSSTIMWLPIIGVVVVLVGVCLLIYFKKRKH